MRNGVKDPVFDMFVEGLIKERDLEKAKQWLKKQTVSDITYFSNIFDFSSVKQDAALILAELSVRDEQRNNRSRWGDRIWGFFSGLFLALIIALIQNNI